MAFGGYNKTACMISVLLAQDGDFFLFLFDAFGEVDDMAIFRVKREEEFAPVKNKEGADSPYTATTLYNALH